MSKVFVAVEVTDVVALSELISWGSSWSAGTRKKLWLGWWAMQLIAPLSFSKMPDGWLFEACRAISTVASTSATTTVVLPNADGSAADVAVISHVVVVAGAT